MKNYSFLFLCLLVLSSCSQQEPSTSLAKLSGQYVEVPGSNIQVLLEKNYKLISAKAYKELVSNSTFEHQLKLNQLKKIEQHIDKYNDATFYIDTLQPQNLAWIKNSDYRMELNPQMLKVAKDSYLQSSNSVGLQEGKLKRKANFSFIKLKTKEIIEGIIQTNYVISSKKSTILISFLNSEQKDFENYMDHIKVY